MQTEEMIKSSEEFYAKQKVEGEENAAICEEQKQEEIENETSDAYFVGKLNQKLKTKRRNRKRNAIAKQSRKANRRN